MKKRILILLLTITRFVGIFALSRKLTTGQLRILCYHGSALLDENEFRPGLFMTARTFERRMAHLRKLNYPVLKLGEALRQLKNGALAPCATVITIDDGWYGTYKNQIPVLNRYAFPATLYIASYYLENQYQVFNVAISYVLWSKKRKTVPADFLKQLTGEQTSGTQTLSCDLLCSKLEEYANSLDGATKRQNLLEQLCTLIDFDFSLLERNRIVSFMNREEAAAAAYDGIDIQLHTHRHRFPDTSFAEAKREIDDNRTRLREVTKANLEHFCYPSGVYSRSSIEFLPNLDISSATTTNPGFNYSDSSPLELNRFLDSELISDIEFEAEMSGFLELIRRTGFRI